MQNLYNTICIRRSCRQYTGKLNSDKLEKLEDFIANSIIPIDESIRYKIEIVSHDAIKSSKFEAPQYVLFYSEDAENYRLNAGYIMEQIDLFVQSLGAGSCWLGLASPKITKIEDKKYVIMLAIGESDKPFRKSVDEFKRKPIEDIGSLLDKDLLEIIRLSPSAVNGQPWFYSQVDDNTLRLDLKRNPLMKMVLFKYDYIDLGISLLYLSLVLMSKDIKNKMYIKDNKKNGVVYIKILSQDD